MWSRFLPLLLILPLTAAPTDEELLKLVKERAALERVTPKPVDMKANVGARCSIDAVLKPGPHAAATFHVYANEPAALPMFDPWGKFPEGSLVLKEKFNREDGKTTLFTGMWKREAGYFPEVNDWEFFTVDGAASKIVQRGKLPQCATCHEDHAKSGGLSRDYVYNAQLSGGRIVLHSRYAQAQGEKLHYEEIEKKNTLGYWTNAGDWAQWHFNVDRPGTYEIHLWQGCGKGSGGSTVNIVSAAQTATFTVEETTGFQDFKERTVGRIHYTATGPQTLEVHATAKPGMAVMDLRQIILVPVQE